MRQILWVLLWSLLLVPPRTGAAAAPQDADSPSFARFVFDGSSSPRLPQEVNDLVAERDAVIQRVLLALGDSAPDDLKIDYHAYPSTELKGLTTGNAHWAHVEPNTETLHVVIDGELRGDRSGLEARLLFRRALGRPALPVLEAGVEAFFSTRWGGREFEYWAARLHSAGLVPSLSTILSRRWIAEESPFIVQPVAGVVIAHLLGRWSRVGFVDRYASWQPDAADIEAMETGWCDFLDAVLRRNQAAIERDLAMNRERRLDGFAPIRGFNYAHEGYRTYDGYLSERSDKSLARLAELGANGVAILPYALMSSPDHPLPLRPPDRVGSETDQAVIQAVWAAQGQGLTILLKPHIWLRGSWPGEIQMRSRDEWNQFFEYYERWILHYAILAEIHQVPALSVGVELSKATLGHEREWKELVSRLRGVYSGALVYAANWGEEFESLDFWDVFDYLGVDAYYPLSDDPDASDEVLRRGADAMLDRIEKVQRRFEKPVLFTEMGFASARGAWVRPWEGNRVEEPSPIDQLRSYRAVIRAMEGREWIGGVFWCEWPSDLRRARKDRRGFMPNGKPVEALLRQWFRETPFRDGVDLP